MGPCGCLHGADLKMGTDAKTGKQGPQEKGKRHIAWEERDSEMGEREPKKSGNGLVEMRKERRVRAGDKGAEMGRRDTRTEMERCPTDTQVPGPSDGHTQARCRVLPTRLGQ